MVETEGGIVEEFGCMVGIVGSLISPGNQVG
jgi:hypothetical protein